MRRRQPEVLEIGQLSTLDLFRAERAAQQRGDRATQERMSTEIRRRSRWQRLKVKD